MKRRFGGNKMSGVRHEKIDQIPAQHKQGGSEYEYKRRKFIPLGDAKQCVVSIYEIPPKKAAYPYHYHCKNEETFYIVSGTGILKTPEGERKVSAGELLFFPADESGAHKLTNDSDTEKLVYIDFDTFNDLDAAVYPDSGKIGVWGRNINRVYRMDDNVDYYDGE